MQKLLTQSSRQYHQKKGNNNLMNKQVDILISKNQALQTFYLVYPLLIL